MIDRSAEQDAAYDRLDDQGQLSSAEIWEQLGEEPEAANEEFTVDAITARAGGEFGIQAAGVEFWDGQNHKDGVNHRGWEESFKDPVQGPINHEGLEKWRAARRSSKVEQ